MPQSPVTRILFTRRHFLGGAAATALLGGTPSLFAADFWNKKSRDQWSSEEIRQIATRSPWAKESRVELKAVNRGGYNGGQGRIEEPGISGADIPSAGRSRIPGADTGGIPGVAPGAIGPDGPGPGGLGGGRGGLDAGMPDALGGQRGPDGMPISAMTAIVRWESAPPLMEALNTKFPPELNDHFVIAVTGVPALTGKVFAPGDEAMQDRLKAGATLQIKGKPAAQAGVVWRLPQGMWFGFAKEFLPVTPQDREVTFNLNIAQLAIRTRFDPKEMTYQGKLAL
jgi:hypothetical protein